MEQLDEMGELVLLEQQVSLVSMAGMAALVAQVLLVHKVEQDPLVPLV